MATTRKPSAKSKQTSDGAADVVVVNEGDGAANGGDEDTGRMTGEAKLQQLHGELLLEFDSVQSVQWPERIQSLADRRFYSIAGAQWEGPLEQQFDNKPRFEMNKTHLAVIRIINEYRNNRITVTFTPKDGSTDIEGAETCDGLYRASEKDSNADEAYDNAFEEAVGGGFGAYRLRADYEDEDDDENTQQKVCIEPIFDADSCVFFDLNAKRQDKKDAKKCWVLTAYSRDAYKDEFGDDPSTWPHNVFQVQFDWYTPDMVYVAECYVVEEKSELIHVYRGLDDEDMFVPDSEFKADPTKQATLEATGFRKVRQKRKKVRAVHKYTMNGARIISDDGIIAGKWIPVVPVYGKRWYVDGVERCMGHVRLAKDAQRLANMLRSKLGEIAALGSVEKPILLPQQVKGHEAMWANDNLDDNPYLLVNPIRDAEGNVVAQGPIGYTKAPEIPPALAALMQITEQDLQDLLGNQQAGEQMQPNLSGKAVELIQNRLDMQVFIYMSNFAKAVKRGGEIWLSMQKDIVVEENRKMKTIDSQGETSSVDVNVPSYDPETGGDKVENDMSKLTFDVDADVGPASASRRAATVRALTGMMSITDDPETKQVLSSMTMMNMEGEGIAETRDFFRAKLVNMGVIKPTKEEAADMQAAKANEKPNANDTYLMAAADAASADAVGKRAKTIDTLADADLKRAQTVKTLAEAGSEQHQQEIATVQTMQDILNDHADRATQPQQPQDFGVQPSSGAI